MSHLHEAKFDTLIAARKAGFASPSAPKNFPPSLELEPTHLDFDLSFDIESENVRGTLITTVRANRDGADSIELDAVDFESLEFSDAKRHKLHFSYNGEKARITWAEGFKRGEERKLVAKYSVTKPVTGLYFSSPSEERPDLQWFCGSDHETERARFWIPCIDQPAVRTTMEMRIRADKSFTALSNGTLMDRVTDLDGTAVTHWKLDQRCPSYLIAVCIGELVEWKGKPFEGRPIAAYTTKDHDAASLERSFGRTREMMAWMTKHLDMPFPYPKYYQYALPSFGGAMENISLVSWDDIFVLDEALAPEWTWLVDQINLHEMSHSYFGDHIVCRDFANAWLKESWAVYIETAWLEFSKGDDEKRYDFWCNAKGYFNEADNSYMRPIMTRHYESSWQMYDRHLYPGGAVRLHTLRSIMGDDDFWNGTRTYLKRYAEKVVETEDFRRVMEEVSGRSLVQFFDQWIYSKGYPNLKVSFSYDEKQKLGTFEIEQKQVTEAKADGDKLPTFHLESDLGWVIGTKAESQPITITKAKQSFTIPMAKEPSQVRFDPHMRTLHKLDFNPGDEKLREQVTKAPDVIGRICAANELCKTGKAKNIHAVGAAYKKEKFWGVRCEMAEAIGAAKSEAALEVALEMAAKEKDPMVLATTLRALANYRDPRVTALLEKRLGAGLPPFAAAAAYEGLGKQRSAAPLELLKSAAHTKDQHFFAHGGALRGLAATRHESVGENLLELIPHGRTNFRARPAVFSALADWASTLPMRERGQYREVLEDILRDPMERMRNRAAGALASLGDPAAVGALSAFRPRLPQQQKIDIDSYVSGLRKSGDGSNAAKLEKQVEELQTERRKMDERLSKLEERLGKGDEK